MKEERYLSALEAPDAFYADLLAAHEGLDKAHSDALNARLILIMAHMIQDPEKLKEALDLAAEAASPV